VVLAGKASKIFLRSGEARKDYAGQQHCVSAVFSLHGEVRCNILKGHWHEKSVSNKHIGGCLSPSIGAASDRPFKIYDFQQHRSIDVKIFLLVALDRKLIWYPLQGSTFCLLSGVLSLVWGLPTGVYNLTSGCHGDSRSVNFSHPVFSPTGGASKMYKPAFFLVICGLPQVFYRDLRPATIAYSGEQRISFVFI
jgi:hypothetical protein